MRDSRNEVSGNSGHLQFRRRRGWREGLWLSVHGGDSPGPEGVPRPVLPSLQTESSLQVLMRQEDVPLGEAVCPSLLAPGLLPSMWQLYPGRRYRGSDSSFWRIVYHIEASVSFSRGPPGRLGGPCSPARMSGL